MMSRHFKFGRGGVGERRVNPLSSVLTIYPLGDLALGIWEISLSTSKLKMSDGGRSHSEPGEYGNHLDRAGPATWARASRSHRLRTDACG